MLAPIEIPITHLTKRPASIPKVLVEDTHPPDLPFKHQEFRGFTFLGTTATYTEAGMNRFPCTQRNAGALAMLGYDDREIGKALGTTDRGIVNRLFEMRKSLSENGQTFNRTGIFARMLQQDPPLLHVQPIPNSALSRCSEALLQVIPGIAEGKSDRNIGDRLNLAEHTVSSRIAYARQITGLERRAQLGLAYMFVELAIQPQE